MGFYTIGHLPWLVIEDLTHSRLEEVKTDSSTEKASKIFLFVNFLWPRDNSTSLNCFL